MTQLAIVENHQILPIEDQLKLSPMEINCLKVVSDDKRTAIFHKGFCCGSFDNDDRFSRNYFLVQLHLSGGLKVKDLSRAFGLQYQHCSTIVVSYRREGLEGIKDQSSNTKGNRLLITPQIGELILKLRGKKKEYEEISKIIRFRFKKKIAITTLMSWVYKEKKRRLEEAKWQQQEMSTESESLSVASEIALQGEVISGEIINENSSQNEGEENWNSYAGSMILYAMLYRSQFLEIFERNISKIEKAASWSVRRVLLTLFFLHALRLKNVEQTKHLVGKDFRELVGGDFLRLQWLRRGIDEVTKSAGFENAQEAHFRNLVRLTERDDKIFYTDGHFSTYYGKQKVPKGYDPRRQMPYRGRNTIYLHNSIGENVLLFESPANTTLSNDMPVLVGEMKKLGVELKGKTMCFDRGGFSLKNFRFLRSEKMYFISYLMHRSLERLVDESEFRVHTITTNEGDIVSYKLFEKEIKETKFGKVRTIILLSNDGKQIPIITTNPYLKVEEVVHILKGRWCEENCFKYMVEHFGIDLLTTYKTEIAPDKIIERPHPERKEVNSLIKIKRHELEKFQAELAKKVRELGEESTQTIKEFYDNEKDLNFKIKNTQVDIDILERKRQTIPTKEKRSLREDHVIMAQKRRFLINTVKCMNYNVEKWLQEIFKKHHAKAGETLSLIRSLYRQPGQVIQTSSGIRVELTRLDSEVNALTLDKVLKNLKENDWLKLPDGRNLEICQMH